LVHRWLAPKKHPVADGIGALKLIMLNYREVHVFMWAQPDR
jgi:hypothetical protein